MSPWLGDSTTHDPQRGSWHLRVGLEITPRPEKAEVSQKLFVWPKISAFNVAVRPVQFPKMWKLPLVCSYAYCLLHSLRNLNYFFSYFYIQFCTLVTPCHLLFLTWPGVLLLLISPSRLIHWSAHYWNGAGYTMKKESGKWIFHVWKMDTAISPLLLPRCSFSTCLSV